MQLHLVEADVLEWEPPVASFELVIIMYLHLPAAPRRRVLRRAASLLAPGATLLVVGHDSTNLTEGIGGARDAVVLFGPEDIVSDLPGLDIERGQSVPAGRWPPTTGRSTPSMPSSALSDRHRPARA